MNNEKIKQLCDLYDKLLKHLDELAKLCISPQIAKDNIDKIKELNERHKKNRDIGKSLLNSDLTKITNNPLYKIAIKQNILPTSIIFINAITDFNKRIVEYYDNNDEENFNIICNDIQDFNKLSKENFKTYKEKIKKYNL